MLSIARNGIITVNRGDDFSIPLFINQGTEMRPIRFELKEDDKVYLGIFSAGRNYLLDENDTKFFIEDGVTYIGIPEINKYFENAIIRKTFTHEDLNENGDVVLEFTHEDTRFLLPGNYFYQIRAEIKKDDKTLINTIVKKTSFIVLE